MHNFAKNRNWGLSFEQYLFFLAISSSQGNLGSKEEDRKKYFVHPKWTYKLEESRHAKLV